MKLYNAFIILIQLFVISMLMSSANASPPPNASITEQPWYIVNDGVMGGLSSSNVSEINNNIVFSGEVSLANNGGFASVRTIMAPPVSSNRVQITVRGDGNVYQLRLKASTSMGGPSYVSEFTTTKNTWQTLTFAADDFDLRYRGRQIADAPPISIAQVEQVGFLIANKQQGAFSLEIASIVFLTSI